MKLKQLVIVNLLMMSGCATLPPKNTDNLCQIFREKDGWYEASLKSARRWGTPIAVQMAIINQESSFVADIEPPRPTFLGFIPLPKASSAHGYAQAKDESWSDYQQNANNSWADRENFADSCDFVAWYCAVSHKKLGIPLADTSNLYLTYHEGLGGFQRNSHLQKNWLLNVAQKVKQRALRYDEQLSNCRQELDAKN